MRAGMMAVILLGGVGAPSFAAPRDRGPIIFDGYHRGVQVYELTVTPSGGEATYSLRRKDVRRNIWNPPVTATASDLGEGAASIELDGAVKAFPSLLPRIAAVDWKELQAASWPGASTVYVRRRTLREPVGDHVVTADHWGVQDGSDPMDLVIGADNAVLAAIDVNADTVMVRRGYEAFTTVAAWRDPKVSQPRYGYRALDLQMTPTRSGARLATRVFLPTGDIKGPFPTILVRNPYGVSNLIDRYEQYVVRGYAVVLQAVQGTAYWDPASRSEGTLRLMVQEPDDGADALKWVTEQPWSNGSICMQGLSYHGYTQWTATMARNPALKCIVPESTLGTAFGDQPYMGGTFIEGSPFYIFWMHGKKLLPGRTWSGVLRYRPIREMDVYATGETIPAWKATVDHSRNDEYWRGQDWFQGRHSRDFGSFQISGWFDDDFAGTRSTWALMQKTGTQPSRLLIGPWKHSYNHDRALNGYSFGIDALRDDIWLTKQKWYDHFLKGVDNGVTDPVVQYFVLGSNEWRTAKSWPPAEVAPQNWYLHSRGQAASRMDDGELTTAEPAGPEAADDYVYNPADPPKNWSSFDLMTDYQDVQSFPYDFKDIEERGDVVTYTSAPLQQDLTIAGDVKLVLYGSTDVKDTDWWAHIADVAPDNSSKRLSVGVIRARFRKLDDPDYHVFGSNFTREDMLSGKLDDVVRYEISLRAIANTFRKGHRIRIAVMNAQENYAFPNSNTGGDEGRVTNTVAGHMRIHHAKAMASHVVLPVLPAQQP